MSTIASYTFDFSTSNGLNSKWKFNPNGGTGLMFDNKLIAGDTSATASNGSIYTVKEGSLIKVSRTGTQQLDLVNGNPYLYISGYLTDFFNITQASRINYINVNVSYDISCNWQFLLTQSEENFYTWMIWNPFVYFTNNGKELGRWITSVDPTLYYRATLEIPESTTIAPPTTVVQTNNVLLDPNLQGIGTGLYQYFPQKKDNWSYSITGMDMLSTDKFNLKLEFCPKIPNFQHTWSSWPWNKSKRQLNTDIIIKSIKFDISYDAVSEHTGTYYTIDNTLSNGSTLYTDPDMTQVVSPNGYVCIGNYFYWTVNGVIQYKGQCAPNITVNSLVDGTSISTGVQSTFPYSQSGTGTYGFNELYGYITLQAIEPPNSTFDYWEATRILDGVTVNLGSNYSLNVDYGIYSNINAKFINGGYGGFIV